MLKKYYILALAIPCYSFAAELPEKEQSMLKKLRKEQGSYLSWLPKELIGQLEIIIAIENSKGLAEALGKIKKIMVEPEHINDSKDPTFTDSIIHALAVKFKKFPGEIAEQLKTEGAERWRTEIRPKQLELLKATWWGPLDRVKELIESGVNVNFLDGSGSTPLISASAVGQTAIVKYLLEHKADINAQNIEGFTALMMAAVNNYPEIVKLLLKADANWALRDNQGKTALDLARKKGHKEIVCMLLELINSSCILQ